MHERPLEALRVNGTRPFFSHPDGAIERLTEAHALLTIVSMGFQDNGDEGVKQTNPNIIASALDGIATLVALSLFHHESAMPPEVDHAED